MTDDAKDTFPFYNEYTIDDTNIGVVNYTYGIDWCHKTPTLETIDNKIENMKVSIKHLESRLSVIEQNMLRLITEVAKILDKVEEKDGKV